MLVAPVAVVAQFTVVHLVLAVPAGAAGHHVVVVVVADGTIIIRCGILVLAIAQHGHAAQGDVVLLGQVPRQSGTGEEPAAAVGILAVVALILVGLQIFLLTLRAATATPCTIADVTVSLQHAARIVHVGARIPTATGVDTSTQRTIVARLAVTLQDDVDDACRAFSRELGRGIVNHLHALNALCWYLLQDVITVVTGHARGLAVDPHLHAGVAAQRNLAVGRHLNGGNLLQQLCGIAAGSSQHVVHAEGLAVYFQFHLRPLASNLHLFQRL